MFARARRLIWAHRADLAGALLSCVGVLVVFAPVLVGGKTLSTAAYTLGTGGVVPFEGASGASATGSGYHLDVSASALAFEPWAEVNAAAIGDGDIPLWNPYQAAGAPQAANMQSAVFDPLNVVVNVHPTPRTWDLTLIGTMVLGALATYVFCRVVGMGYLASVVGSTAYSLSGYFSLYSNTSFIRSLVYLPLLCVLIEWVLRSRRFAPIPVLGIASFGCVAAGMPEIAVFVLLVGSAYAVYRVATGPRVHSRWSSVARLVGGFGFGAALALPLLLLFAEYERLSFNIHKGESGIGLLTDPPERLLNWLAPFFNGLPNSATSAPGTISGTRNWLGGAVFALVLIGLVSRTRAARLVTPFFALVGMLLLAKSYGLPLLDWIGHLPVLERVHAPGFGLPLVGFALAIVAAAGVDGVRRGEIRRSWLAVVLVLAVAGVFALARLNADVFELIPRRQLFAELGLAAVMFVGVLVLALAPVRRVGAYAAAAIVALELVLLAPDPFAERRDPFIAPAWVEALQRRLEDGPTDRIFALDTLMFPNTATAYELYDVRMLDALYNDRYFRYLKAFVVPGMIDRYAGDSLGSNEGISAYRDNQMFDLLGVRYVLATEDEAIAALNELLPVGSATDVLRVATLTVGAQARPAIVEHAPGDTALVLPVPVAGTFTFDYGVDDGGFGDASADGVEFSVVGVRQSGASEVLWSGLYAPGDPLDPLGPVWRAASVDIPSSDDPVIELRLQTDPRANPMGDWAGWSSIELIDEAGRPVASAGSLEEVAFVDGVRIYENPDVSPRAFVVPQVTVVPDVEAAEAAFASASHTFANGALRVDGFDIRERAIVEAESSAIPSALTGEQPACDAAESEVQLAAYDSNEVVLDVDAACAGLLVLSDTYFPGWQATVDGRAATIHPTNVAFRGVVVPAGRSEVVFRYSPPNFRAGMVVACGAVVAMAVAGFVVSSRSRRVGAPVR